MMKSSPLRNIFYWFLQVVCYLLPVVVHCFVFRPLWFLADATTVTLVESAFSVLITPVYLLIIFVVTNKQLKFSSSVLQLCIIVVISVFGGLLHYYNWGIYTGFLKFPDSETVLITQTEICYATIISAIGWLIVYMLKRRL